MVVSYDKKRAVSKQISNKIFGERKTTLRKSYQQEGIIKQDELANNIVAIPRAIQEATDELIAVEQQHNQLDINKVTSGQFKQKHFVTQGGNNLQKPQEKQEVKTTKGYNIGKV